MPQLNPAPWFLILMSTWVSYLALTELTCSTLYPNPLPPVKVTKMTNSWHWSWS
uniref:ATP synthase complex subunit 8 n=1 Tax=Hemitheconyx caudicinctus TaxID=96741 RepID=I7HHF1_9SAUR|nr:ATP synthase F0 subunit 8 [Hemitheconyx caudicinctus]BAM34424.1 ATPase subunit 8 [Hemitheconyx caudicinctus]